MNNLMKTNSTVLASLAILGSWLVGVPAEAQQHGHQRGDKMSSPMGQMQRCHAMAGAPPPMMILHHQEDLDLSPSQVERLETLGDESRRATEPHMRQAMEARMQASSELQADQPDLDTYRRSMEEVASNMIQAHMAMAESALEGRDVLNPEQRGQMRTMMKGEHHREGMMHQRRMGRIGQEEAPDRPMMGCMMMGAMHGSGGAG